MFKPGDRVKSVNGPETGTITRKGPPHIIEMFGGSETKRRWYVLWDGDVSRQEQLEWEESLVHIDEAKPKSEAPARTPDGDDPAPWR